MDIRKLLAVCIYILIFIYVYLKYESTPIYVTIDLKEEVTKSTNAKFKTNCTDDFRRNHLITLRDLIGRTGNQMFQILMLLATAENNCYTPVLRRNYNTYPINVTEHLFDLTFITRIHVIPSEWRNVYSDPYLHKYLTVTESLDAHFNYTFAGFFQNWKYFFNQETYIRSILKFKPDVIQAVKFFFENVSFEPGTIKIGVHVRREDMVNTKGGFATANMEYISSAMRYFTTTLNRSKVVFVVVTENIRWCRDNIHECNAYFSPFSSGNKIDTVGRDLCLLSLCDHVIITSGTFGWIGTWLARGKVVYNKGYPRPGSDLDKRLNRSTYYLPSWIGLE